MVAQLSLIRSFIVALFLITVPSVHPRPLVSQEPKSLEPRNFHGKATWFIPDTGACGDVNSNSDYIVAMNYAQYHDGSPCHKVVVITNKANHKVVKARVTDECPSCPYGSLDLSPAAFKKLGNLDTGVLPITWDWA